VTPEITLVVASHARALRLRWLLNALEEQTLERSRWELVVVHDNAGEETEQLLRGHPLAEAGVLRHHRLAVGTGTPAVQRNTGWRDARAPLVAFTDDDCRPDPAWLERMLSVADENPGAIVQGATRPEPHEAALLVAPRTRTLHVDPPAWEVPTCNVVYPRALLERSGGFDEAFPGAAGEDTDLAERARALGADLVAAPEAVVYHAVEAYSLRDMARLTWKWRDLPLVVKRHPHLRSRAPLGVFWKHSHWRLLLALAGVAGARRVPPLALLTLPYLRHAAFVHGRRPAAVGRAVIELPSRTAIDLVEIAAVTSGSVRHRTPVL
jgi:glycosyltransferase involved in cell wall biosynthesis